MWLNIRFAAAGLGSGVMSMRSRSGLVTAASPLANLHAEGKHPAPRRSIRVADFESVDARRLQRIQYDALRCGESHGHFGIGQIVAVEADPEMTIGRCPFHRRVNHIVRRLDLYVIRREVIAQAAGISR